MCVPDDHLGTLCPSSSATVRISAPAITSLLANVWRLQCQVYSSNLASSRAVENHPSLQHIACAYRREGRTVPGGFSLPSALEAPPRHKAMASSGIERESPFLARIKSSCRHSKSTWLQRRLYCSLMRILVSIDSRRWGRNSAKRRSMAACKRFSSGSDKILTRPPGSARPSCYPDRLGRIGSRYLPSSSA